MERAHFSHITQTRSSVIVRKPNFIPHLQPRPVDCIEKDPNRETCQENLHLCFNKHSSSDNQELSQQAAGLDLNTGTGGYQEPSIPTPGKTSVLHHESSPRPHSESKLQLDHRSPHLSQTFQNNSSSDDQRNTKNRNQALNCNEGNKLQSVWQQSDGLGEHTNKQILDIKFNPMNHETADNTNNKKSNKISNTNFNSEVLNLNECKFAEHKQFDTCTNVNLRTNYDTNIHGSNNHGCCESRSGPNQYELSNNISDPGSIHDTEYSCIRSKRFMSQDSCARSEKSSVRYYNAIEKESPFFQYPLHISGKDHDLHHIPQLTPNQTFLKHCNGSSSHQRYQQNVTVGKEYSSSIANNQMPSSHQLLKVTQNPEQFLKGTSEYFEPAMNQADPRHRRMSVQYSPEICNMPSNQYGFSQMTNQHDIFQMRMHQHNLAIMSTNNQESSRVHHTEQQLTSFSGLPAFPFYNAMGSTSSPLLEQTHKRPKLHQHQQELLQKMSANHLNRISAISNNPLFGFVNPPVFGFDSLPLGLRNFSQISMNIPEHSHQEGKDQRPLSPRSKTNNWDCKEKSRYSTGECGHFQNDHSAKCSPPTNSSHNQSPPNTSESQSCKQTSCAHIQQPDQGSTPGLDEVNDPAGQSDSELQNQDYENSSGGSKRKHDVEDLNPNANKIKKGVPSEEKSRSNLDSESEFSCVPFLPEFEDIKRETLSPAQINQGFPSRLQKYHSCSSPPPAREYTPERSNSVPDGGIKFNSRHSPPLEVDSLYLKVEPDYPSPTDDLIRNDEPFCRPKTAGKSSVSFSDLEPGSLELKKDENVPARPGTVRKRRKKSEIDNNEDRRPISDCNVCGDKAIAHMHYGGICCYSCKAFFRRAVQSGKDKKYLCKGEGHCPVSVHNRRGCQKCRFEKCQEIGMVSTWVLSDEQCEQRFGKSKLKRKGGYDSTPKKVKEEFTVQVHKQQPRDEMFNKLTDTDELSIEYMSCVYEASKEMISFSEENEVLWSKLFQESHAKKSYSSTEMSGLIQTVIKKNIFFLEANSYFKKLDFDDKREILKKNMTEMGQLRGALRFDPRDKKFVWYFNQKDKPKVAPQVNEDTKKIDANDLVKFYKSKDAVSSVMKTMERIVREQLSSEVILILMHVVIFSADGLELNKPEFIENVQSSYFNLLYRYIINQHGNKHGRNMLSKIVSLLTDLRQLCEEYNNAEAAGYD